MKKFAIAALSAVMILGLFAGCRRNVPADSTGSITSSTTQATTHATTQPSTQATTQPSTQATTQPSTQQPNTSRPSEGSEMPTDMLPGTDGGNGRGRGMMPRF